VQPGIAEEYFDDGTSRGITVEHGGKVFAEHRKLLLFSY